MNYDSGMYMWTYVPSCCILLSVGNPKCVQRLLVVCFVQIRRVIFYQRVLFCRRATTDISTRLTRDVTAYTVKRQTTGMNKEYK
jgi:hypothetical protein